MAVLSCVISIRLYIFDGYCKLDVDQFIGPGGMVSAPSSIPPFYQEENRTIAQNTYDQTVHPAGGIQKSVPEGHRGESDYASG